jgi:adenosylcobinamide-phosphate synthase
MALPLALVVDRVVGDPAAIWSRLPHPTALIGRLVETLDRRLNVEALPASARRRRGVAALAICVALGAAVGAVVSSAASSLAFGWAIEGLVASILLAQKSLLDHVGAVAEALEIGVEEGRASVARIVGRDVRALDEAGVARAAIESAAENFSDGVVAPALWYLMLGLPGLLIYKAVNTADSMIGYRTPRHEAFGWASARFDDVLNFVPARLSALLIAGLASIAGGSARSALCAALSDARQHKSPNAGWPEAAMAGALGLALGGPRRYGPLFVDGAWLNGRGRRAAGRNDIRAALRLIDLAWMLLLLTAFGIALISLWLGR